jgi:hypothetical protein
LTRFRVLEAILSSSGAATICQYRLLTDSKEKACDIRRIILVVWTAGKGAATCCGSTVSVANGGLLVFSGPDSASRKNMSIYTSTDSGKYTGGCSKTRAAVSATRHFYENSIICQDKLRPRMKSLLNFGNNFFSFAGASWQQLSQLGDPSLAGGYSSLAVLNVRSMPRLAVGHCTGHANVSHPDSTLGACRCRTRVSVVAIDDDDDDDDDDECVCHCMIMDGRIHTSALPTR